MDSIVQNESVDYVIFLSIFLDNYRSSFTNLPIQYWTNNDIFSIFDLAYRYDDVRLLYIENVIDKLII